MENIVFIDGQNLHFRTKDNNWKIDYKKFSVYLKEKYSISTIYYFIGYKSEKYKDLYSKLENADFIIVFKEHLDNFLSYKKGNIDTDMVFEIMKNIIDNTNLNKIIIVSGDGDYKKVIDYLILKEKFLKILFPSKKSKSSLYKKMHNSYFDYLDTNEIKQFIEYKEK